MTITPAQIKTIAIKFPKKEDRELIVAQYTNDATKTSTKDLTFAQAKSLLQNVKNLSSGGVGEVKTRFLFFEKTNAHHRRILSTCIQLGWSKSHDRHGEIADTERLKKWLKSNKSPVATPADGVNKLSNYNKFELSKIIIALDNMTFKHHEKQSKKVPAS